MPQRALALCSAASAALASGATDLRLVKKQFTVGHGLTKRTYWRLAINGSGPLWRDDVGGSGVSAVVTEPGEEFAVNYVNEIGTPTIIHAHGQTPPLRMDGVPFISQPPIQPGERSTYRFRPRSGTYFLHAHYGFDHVNLLAAPLLVRAPAPAGYPGAAAIDAAADVPIVIEDFCPYTIGQKGGYDGECHLKDSADGATPRQGYHACPPGGIPPATPGLPGTPCRNGWDVRNGAGETRRNVTSRDECIAACVADARCKMAVYVPSENADCSLDGAAKPYATMKAEWRDMQVGWNYSKCRDPLETSDEVDFRYHLMNGRTFDDPTNIFVDAGQTIRLRVVNSASTTDYKLDLGALNGTAIATDGQPCHPYTAAAHWVWVAQRLDILVTIPGGAAPGAAFPVTAQGGAPWPMPQAGAVLVVRGGAPPPPGTYPVSATDGVGPPPDAAWVAALRAWTGLKSRAPDRTYTVAITGDRGFNGLNGTGYQLPPLVPRYAPNPHPLKVRRGERVCLRVVNHNAHPHPFHLHGHVFQIVEYQGAAIEGPMRDTFLMLSGGCFSVKICFDADQVPGDIWPFHCHMNYHLAAGMMTTVEYEDEQ